MTPLPPPIPSATTLSLPADQFYWSVLDASVLPKPNRSPPPEQLGYLFEQVLPVPIDQVHAVYVRIDRTKYLACGMDRHRLTEIIGASREQDLLELRPESIPNLDPDLAGVPPHSHSRPHPRPDSINLLTEAFEPKPVRRLKTRWFTQVAALIALVTMLGIFGLERRTRQLDGQVTQIQHAQTAVYQQVLGSGALSLGGQPAALQLTAQLRRLRQTRQSAAGYIGKSSVPMLIDCTKPFSSLLSIWPATGASHKELFMQTESIVITPSALTVRGTVPSTADAEKLVAALTQPVLMGWQSQQPQVNTSSQAVQVSLQWRATPTNPPASPAVVHAPWADS